MGNRVPRRYRPERAQRKLKISSLPHQVDTELLHDPFYKFEPYNAADTGRYKNGVIGRMKRPEME